MDKDLTTILDETLKLCGILMKDDKYFVFAWNLSKAILAYQLRSASNK